MKPIAIATLFFCIEIGSAFSQTHYIKGLIIKKSGDTIKGLIDFRDWTKTPKQIDFKIDDKSNEKLSYKASDILGFDIIDLEKYRSYTGPVTLCRNNNRLVDQLPIGIDTSKRLDTLFLRQISTGKDLTLFEQEDDIKFRYFVKENNKSIIELLNFPYFNDDGKLIPAAIYKGQLIAILNSLNLNSNSLSDKVHETDFSEQSLIKIIEKINQNSISTRVKVGKRQFIGLSYTLSEIYFGDNFQSVRFPEFSYGIDFAENKEIQKRLYRLQLSVYYTNFNFYNYFSTAGVYTPNQISNYNIDRYTIKLSTLYFLNLYNKEKFKIFIGTGLHYNYSFFSSKYTNSSTKQEYPNEIFFDYNFGFKNFWFNPTLFAGIKLNNKFSLTLTDSFHTYYFTSSNDDNKYGSPNNSISLGLNYFFGNSIK